MVQRAAEPAEVEEPFVGAIEGNPHAVEQVDDLRGGVAHPLHRRLLGEEVAALERVFDVDVRVVPLALGVHGAVDAALRADGVTSLHRDDGEDVDVLAGLGKLDHRHESCEAAADDDVAFWHGARVIAHSCCCRNHRWRC